MIRARNLNQCAAASVEIIIIHPRRIASGRATELTFPRNKFHLVRGQITDVMRMVGAVGNYVFAVIGGPRSSKGKKSHHVEMGA